ncbi:MAG TPA: hypothetical protein VIV15_06595, partial [Anaerolineales bacterium]
LVVLISALLLGWTSIPNWRGYSLQNEEWSFSGTFYDATDYAVHVAMLRAGMQGDWAYSFRFTTEPHSPQYIRLFYIALGQLNRILKFEPERLYHAARWFLGIAALMALYRLLGRIFPSQRSRWIAFFLIAAGSGLGFLERMFGWGPGQITPVDFWLIDAYMLFSLAIFPHFAFTLALMCAGITGYLDYLEKSDYRNLGIVVGTALLVQLVNPIAYVSVDVMLFALTILGWWKNLRILWREAWALGFIALAQLPLLRYNFLLLNNDPLWSQFTAQNLTLSPAPVYYVWGFGLFWLFGLVGAALAFKKRDPIPLAAFAWLLSAFIFAYVPWAIQRRFLLGITIPFGILSAYALEWISTRMNGMAGSVSRRVPALILLVVSFMSMTSIVLSPAYAVYLGSHPAASFYPHSLDPAFTWIAGNTQPDDFILGAENTGRLLAQKTGRRVYLGHAMETLHYSEKLEEVSAFYQGKLSADWLSGLPIEWIVYGPFEQQLASDFQPDPNLSLA